MTDEAFDVVICGYGGAGAAAAIEAHDLGARVLVAEKAEEGGGSTQESGGSLATIEDPGAVEHYLALTEGRTPRAVVEAYVAGVVEVEGWIRANGGELEPLPMRRPPFPHRYEGTAYATMPHADAIGRRVRLAETGVDHGGTTLWHFLDRNVRRARDRGTPRVGGQRPARLRRRGVRRDVGDRRWPGRRGGPAGRGAGLGRVRLQRRDASSTRWVPVSSRWPRRAATPATACAWLRPWVRTSGT